MEEVELFEFRGPFLEIDHKLWLLVGRHFLPSVSVEVRNYGEQLPKLADCDAAAK